MAYQSVRDQLSAATLTAFVARNFADPSKLYSASESDVLIDGLKLLAKSDKLSIPLRDDNGEFTKSFDVIDVVQRLHTEFQPEELFSAAFDEILEAPEKLEKFVETAWGKLYQTPLGEIANSSGRNAFVTVDQSKSMLDAALLMYTHKIHRVGVLHDGKLVAIITQSDIVRFLDANNVNLASPSALDETVESTNFAARRDKSYSLINVNGKDKAIACFLAMSETRVSGVAITGDKQNIVGVLSAHDLKGLFLRRAEFLRQLFELSSAEFCTIIHASTSAIAPREVITVKRTDTLKKVAELLVHHRIHRVFVVDDDENKTLADVVSVSDLLERLLAV